MIQITDLTFSYKSNNPIFSNINLTISPGNIYGLLGENGTGKTSLLRIMCGLLFPNLGSCKTFKYEAKERNPNMLQEMYYLPEVFNVPNIKITEYEKIYSELYPNFSHSQFKKYLEQFSVNEKMKMKELSYGQQKKAMIAFAFACKTQLLLMDEPTNGLDIPSKSIFRQIITENTHKNTTFIISTHQVRDLENLIDPIIIIEKNQILLNNFVKDIVNKLKFTLTPEQNKNALYYEQTIGGYLSVEPNNDNSNSQINIEILFNAAIKNKDFFLNNFINKTYENNI